MPVDCFTRPTDALVQSAHDGRVYRRMTLPNGLRVTLVQHEPRGDDCGDDSSSDGGDDDSSSDGGDDVRRPSAVALAVSVGHFRDPDNLPGLAHLLEHMSIDSTAR